MVPLPLHLLLLVLFALAFGTGASPADDHAYGQNATIVFDLFGIGGADNALYIPMVDGGGYLENFPHVSRAKTSPQDTPGTAEDDAADEIDDEGNLEPYDDPRSVMRHPRLKKHLTAAPLAPRLLCQLENVAAVYSWVHRWLTLVIAVALFPIHLFYVLYGWWAVFLVTMVLAVPVFVHRMEIEEGDEGGR